MTKRALAELKYGWRFVITAERLKKKKANIAALAWFYDIEILGWTYFLSNYCGNRDLDAESRVHFLLCCVRPASIIRLSLSETIFVAMVAGRESLPRLRNLCFTFILD